jgi:hypothetical protein
VYFDSLNIKWEYEKEGYQLPSGWYLPDFWLSESSSWAEVKPNEFSELEKSKCRELAEFTKCRCFELVGIPKVKSYFAHSSSDAPEYEPKNWILLNYHNESGRLYFDPADGEFDDYRPIQLAIEAAKSARFEYGEQPLTIYDDKKAQLAAVAE